MKRIATVVLIAALISIGCETASASYSRERTAPRRAVSEDGTKESKDLKRAASMVRASDPALASRLERMAERSEYSNRQRNYHE